LARTVRRQGNGKLIKNGNNPVRLFDLAADLGETRNLAEQKPEVVQQLTAALRWWNAQLAKPLWNTPR
jgi:hypothetical protein